MCVCVCVCVCVSVCVRACVRVRAGKMAGRWASMSECVNHAILFTNLNNFTSTKLMQS